MNVHNLKKVLESEKIPKWYYWLGEKDFQDDKICLELSDGVWQVYYSERGKKYNISTFATESDACDEALLRIRKMHDNIRSIKKPASTIETSTKIQDGDEDKYGG